MLKVKVSASLIMLKLRRRAEFQDEMLVLLLLPAGLLLLLPQTLKVKVYYVKALIKL